MDGRLRRIQEGPGTSRRTVLGAGLVLAAAALGFVAWERDAPGATAWVAREEVPVASPVSDASFDRVAVSVPDPAVLFPVTAPPSGMAARTIAPGEPLLATDVTGSHDGVAVTLALPPERLPASLAAGTEVDVWTGPPGSPRLVMSGVTVAGVGADIAGTAQVEVLVPVQSAAEAVAAALADDLVVVRRP